MSDYVSVILSPITMLFSIPVPGINITFGYLYLSIFVVGLAISLLSIGLVTVTRNSIDASKPKQNRSQKQKRLPKGRG